MEESVTLMQVQFVCSLTLLLGLHYVAGYENLLTRQTANYSVVVCAQK